MIVGTTFFKMGGTAYYSPEFPRGGLSPTMGGEMLEMIGSPSLTIMLQGRNADETSFADVSSFQVITATGVFTGEFTALPEILRFKYTFDGADAAADGVHLSMQAPSWRPY